MLGTETGGRTSSAALAVKPTTSVRLSPAGIPASKSTTDRLAQGSLTYLYVMPRSREDCLKNNVSITPTSPIAMIVGPQGEYALGVSFQ